MAVSVNSSCGSYSRANCDDFNSTTCLPATRCNHTEGDQIRECSFQAWWAQFWPPHWYCGRRGGMLLHESFQVGPFSYFQMTLLAFIKDLEWGTSLMFSSQGNRWIQSLWTIFSHYGHLHYGWEKHGALLKLLNVKVSSVSTFNRFSRQCCGSPSMTIGPCNE